MIVFKTILLILGIWIFTVVATYYITRTIVVAYHEGIDLYKRRRRKGDLPHGKEES